MRALVVCDRALSCFSMKSGPTALRKVSQLDVELHPNTFQLSEHPCQQHVSPYAPSTHASPHHHGPTSVSIVSKDIAVGITLSSPSPYPYTSVTCKPLWSICSALAVSWRWRSVCSIGQNIPHGAAVYRGPLLN